MYLISGCLLGYNCKYNGGNNHCQWVCDFAEKHSCYAVCPETAGELPVPREPSEIVFIDGVKRVVSSAGNDVTEAFYTGSNISLEKAKKEALRRNEKIEGAILKANSPSCGCGKIYDGTFTGKTVDGNGIFAEMLLNEGIIVCSEKETKYEKLQRTNCDGAI